MHTQMKIATGLSLILALTTACGKGGGGGSTEQKPKKPTQSTPAIPTVTATSTTPSETGSTGTGTAVTGTTTSGSGTTSPTNTSGTGTTTGGTTSPSTNGSTSTPSNSGSIDKFAHAVKGIWGVAIAQKPRACSSFYDLRNVETLSIHLLCPGDKGKTIALQTETFTRMSDDGSKASFKRVASTCGVSPTTAGTVFLSYKTDAAGKLTLNEGSKSSPVLEPIAESNLAADLKGATSLHGRSIVRGCFKNGNLQTFEPARG